MHVSKIQQDSNKGRIYQLVLYLHCCMHRFILQGLMYEKARQVKKKCNEDFIELVTPASRQGHRSMRSFLYDT